MFATTSSSSNDKNDHSTSALPILVPSHAMPYTRNGLEEAVSLITDSCKPASAKSHLVALFCFEMILFVNLPCSNTAIPCSNTNQQQIHVRLSNKRGYIQRITVNSARVQSIITKNKKNKNLRRTAELNTIKKTRITGQTKRTH